MRAREIVEKACTADPVKEPKTKPAPKAPGDPRPGTSPYRGPNKRPNVIPRPKGKKKTDVAKAPGRVTFESIRRMADRAVTRMLDDA